MYIQAGTLFMIGFLALLLAAMWRERGIQAAVHETKEESLRKVDAAVENFYLSEEEASRVKRVIRGY